MCSFGPLENKDSVPQPQDETVQECLKSGGVLFCFFKPSVFRKKKTNPFLDLCHLGSRWHAGHVALKNRFLASLCETP